MWSSMMLPPVRLGKTGSAPTRPAAERSFRHSPGLELDSRGIDSLLSPTKSSPGLWRKLRSAAGRVGALPVFPNRTVASVIDDHIPFLDRGVPSIDLIDFDFPCWHRRCDDMSAVSQRSVNAVGETINELLKSL